MDNTIIVKYECNREQARRICSDQMRAWTRSSGIIISVVSLIVLSWLFFGNKGQTPAETAMDMAKRASKK
jgi:hypothetical protein